MIEVFQYYSKYNQLVNAEMMKVIEGAKDDVFDAPVDGYFKNIKEILDHIYIVDVMGLVSFKTVKEYSIFKDSVFKTPLDRNSLISSDFASFRKNREHLDALFVQLTDEIREADLSKYVTRTNRQGEKQEKLFWKTLMHTFNHQTHHRGEVSQILDQCKVENDYSSMIRIE
ncbi:MAG: DinB family protein [Spirochaetaceae bacterium]|nr:DinB family protein [Spirochaetaceae bacterium]